MLLLVFTVNLLMWRKIADTIVLQSLQEFEQSLLRDFTPSTSELSSLRQAEIFR